MRIATPLNPPHPNTPSSNCAEAMRIASAITLLVHLAAACARSEDRTRAEPFDGDNAYALVSAQLSFGPRIPGSEGHRLAGNWIVEQLRDWGWAAVEQTHDYFGLPVRNLIGRGGPEQGAPILLGAHYDTRPLADRDPDHPDQPVPGANDGASGAAVLLELARVTPPSALSQEVWLVFFDAEDGGGSVGGEPIVGSSLFVEKLVTSPQAVVIVDMVGDRDLHLFQEGNSDAELTASIWQMASSLGYSAFIPKTKSYILDDHTPFLRRGIPAVDIIDFDYPYWHTTEDTLDKVSPDSLEQVGRTLQAWLAQWLKDR